MKTGRRRKIVKRFSDFFSLSLPSAVAISRILADTFVSAPQDPQIVGILIAPQLVPGGETMDFDRFQGL